MELKLELKDVLLEKPKESGEYLCKVQNEWVVLYYSAKNKLFNALDDMDYETAVDSSIRVNFWAALPEL